MTMAGGEGGWNAGPYLYIYTGKPTIFHYKTKVEPEFAIDFSMNFPQINQAHPVLKIL